MTIIFFVFYVCKALRITVRENEMHKEEAKLPEVFGPVPKISGTG